MPNQRMQNLFDLVCEAVRVVQNCGRPGWLLRGACDERSVEDFIMVHSTILETLRVCCSLVVVVPRVYRSISIRSSRIRSSRIIIMK